MAAKTPSLQPNIIWRSAVVAWQSETLSLISTAFVIIIIAYTFLINSFLAPVSSKLWSLERENCIKRTAKLIPGTVWDKHLGCIHKTDTRPRPRTKTIITEVDESRWFLKLAALARPWQCNAVFVLILLYWTRRRS